MATIKSYTDLEQSRKLVKILPLESADMIYVHTIDLKGDEHYNIDFLNINPLFEDDVCAWSLAALFGVLPNKIVSHETAFEEEDAQGINEIYYKRIEPTEDGRYTCCYVGNGCIYEYVADNPVDACVAMVKKLNELKIL